MAPRADLPRAHSTNGLDCQTGLTAHIVTKSISGAVANRPALPPPKMRSPASVAAERGANRKTEKQSHAKNTKNRKPAQAPERHSFALTHGRETAGYIEQEGKSFAAKSVHGHRPLGTFKTLKAACEAISAAYGGDR